MCYFRRRFYEVIKRLQMGAAQNNGPATLENGFTKTSNYTLNLLKTLPQKGLQFDEMWENLKIVYNAKEMANGFIMTDTYSRKDKDGFTSEVDTDLAAFSDDYKTLYFVSENKNIYFDSQANKMDHNISRYEYKCVSLEEKLWPSYTDESKSFGEFFEEKLKKDVCYVGSFLANPGDNLGTDCVN